MSSVHFKFYSFITLLVTNAVQGIMGQPLWIHNNLYSIHLGGSHPSSILIEINIMVPPSLSSKTLYHLLSELFRTSPQSFFCMTMRSHLDY